MTTILVDSADCAQVDYCVHDILAVKPVIDALLSTPNRPLNN